MRLIEGVVASPDTTDAETIDLLRDEIAQLCDQLRAAHREASTAKRDAARGVGELRRLLKPWYQALQMIYGEMDAAGLDDAPEAPSARTSAIWDQWKQKLGKGPAKAIDALLMHGEMTRKQIAVVTGYSPQNVSNIISDLNGASLITKNGDKVALRKF